MLNAAQEYFNAVTDTQVWISISDVGFFQKDTFESRRRELLRRKEINEMALSAPDIRHLRALL